MAEYLHFDRKTVADISAKNIEALYDKGYVFTRRGKGLMDQTRSVRIDLGKFELSSENRRIIKKNEGLKIESAPLPYAEYDWQIGKLAKDFYDTKFGEGTFSANKIKELLTEKEKSNFNTLLAYFMIKEPDHCIAFGSNPPADFDNLKTKKKYAAEGYAICYESKNILHYSYPFYNLNTATKDTGMGMMLLAILYAREHGKKYIYLGSAQRQTDVYKLQFKGLQWFDAENWSSDMEKLKTILT